MGVYSEVLKRLGSKKAKVNIVKTFKVEFLKDYNGIPKGFVDNVSEVQFELFVNELKVAKKAD